MIDSMEADDEHSVAESGGDSPSLVDPLMSPRTTN